MRRKPRQPKPPVKETGGLHSEIQGAILEVSDDPRLDRIADGVDKLVAGIDKLVAAIPKPVSRLRRLVEVFITIIALASAVSVIDVIINWIGD